MTPETDITALEKASRAWGSEMPDWVRALAAACDETSQSKVAKALVNSPTVISRVLGRTYPGNMKKIEEKVRGRFLSEQVRCPVLQDISRQRCIAEQEKKLSAQNPLRVRLYRACRGGCPHFVERSGK